MSNISVVSELTHKNMTCPLSLRWSSSNASSQRPAFGVCIIPCITHSIFWLQVIFCSSVRQKSMQWLYAFLITDILLLFRFFFTFIVHTQSNECIPNRIWSSFICYFEAIFDNYLNILAVYILLALNICRYIQIVYNRNVYIHYTRLLFCTHLIIYLIPLISFIVQLPIGWAPLIRFAGGSCDIAYTSGYVQAINILCGFALPIFLNILVIYFSIRHVRLISRLHRGQHHVSARDKYHRSLVIQFTVFYTVWLLLWSPAVIVYQFASGISTLTVITPVLNYIEITLDPIIIGALDVRFQKVWLDSWTYLRYNLIGKRPTQRRIVPLTTNQHVWSIDRHRQQQSMFSRA